MKAKRTREQLLNGAAVSALLPGDRVMAVHSDGRDTAIGTVRRHTCSVREVTGEESAHTASTGRAVRRPGYAATSARMYLAPTTPRQRPSKNTAPWPTDTNSCEHRSQTQTPFIVPIHAAPQPLIAHSWGPP